MTCTGANGKVRRLRLACKSMPMKTALNGNQKLNKPNISEHMPMVLTTAMRDCTTSIGNIFTPFWHYQLGIRCQDLHTIRWFY
jgi:hypothetical protein